MRILVLHNTYQHAGGEDVAVAMEVAMLREAGHAVELATVSNDGIVGFSGKLKTLLRTPYNAARGPWLDHLLDRTGAELVHVHNFFPLLTPAVHVAAARRGVAVVQTLHNFRLICAGAMLLRDGRVCEDCLTGSRANGVLHRCYRGSLAGSAAVVAMQSRAERKRIWHEDVHRFIALTDFARTKFVAGGLPADRIAIKPNAIVSPALGPSSGRKGALFVGRLSPEKGVDVLLRAWSDTSPTPLTIVGDGPERKRLEAIAPRTVRFLGKLGPEDVRREMLAAQYLVMPSIWYEGFPMTIVEAFAAGLPVVASQIGSLAEIVEDGRTGRHFRAGDSAGLAAIVDQLAAAPELLADYGRAARLAFETRYTPAQNLIALERIYDEALQVAR